MTSPVIYPIGVSAPITPAEPLPPLPEIPRGSLVVVEGRAPIWRRRMALHHLHGSPAAAIAFRDPRPGGAVVVTGHSREWAVGDVVYINPRDDSGRKWGGRTWADDGFSTKIMMKRIF